MRYIRLILNATKVYDIFKTISKKSNDECYACPGKIEEACDSCNWCEILYVAFNIIDEIEKKPFYIHLVINTPKMYKIFNIMVTKANRDCHRCGRKIDVACGKCEWFHILDDAIRMIETIDRKPWSEFIF